MISFFSVVALSVTTHMAYRLSQRGGSYEYNTMSAMCVVEFFKLLISLVHYHKGRHHQGQLPVFQEDSLKSALRNVSPTVYKTYAALALSYAVYNQLMFSVMNVADPGTFSLLKSFTSFLVSLLNFFLFGEALTELQWFCVVIQIFGVVPVIIKSECNHDDHNVGDAVELSYRAVDLILMVFCCLMASLNTVYNAAVVKKVDVPVSLQNILLYSFGVLINTVFYFVYTSGSDSFFHGFGHPGVILLLTLNSFVGIAITMMYKYGDAVLKTLTTPVSSAILVYISYLLFDVPLNIVKAAGAGVVVVDTLLYLRLPSRPPVADAEKWQGRSVQSSTVMKLTIVFAVIGAILIGGPASVFPSFAT